VIEGIIILFTLMYNKIWEKKMHHSVKLHYQQFKIFRYATQFNPTFLYITWNIKLFLLIFSVILFYVCPLNLYNILPSNIDQQLYPL
jgi:hypothetical protein